MKVISTDEIELSTRTATPARWERFLDDIHKLKHKGVLLLEHSDLGLNPAETDKAKLRSMAYSLGQFLKRQKLFHKFHPVATEQGIAVVRRQTELDPETANVIKERPKKDEAEGGEAAPEREAQTITAADVGDAAAVVGATNGKGKK